MATLAVMVAAWRVAVFDTWVTTTLTTFGETNTSALGFGHANPVRVLYDTLGDGTLLVRGWSLPGLTRWNPQTARAAWDLPNVDALGQRSDRVRLATAEDQVTIVAIDLETGTIAATPFRLPQPKMTFAGSLTAGDSIIAAQPDATLDQIVLWSVATATAVATIDGFIAPAGTPQLPMDPGAYPDDLFARNTIVTKDLSRMVVPCRMHGTVAACLWSVTDARLLRPLSDDFSDVFGGYAVDEDRKVVVTIGYRASEGVVSLWSLENGTLVRTISIRRSTESSGPSWPMMLAGRHLLIPNGEAHSLIDMASLSEPTLTLRAVRAGRTFVGGSHSPSAVAWQDGEVGTAVWDLNDQHAPHILRGLAFNNIEFLLSFPELERVVVGLRATVEIWNLSAGTRLGGPMARDVQTSVNATLDGRGLVVHKLDGALSIIDLLDGERVLVLPFVASSAPLVRWSAAARIVDVYTDGGELQRHQWQRVNRIYRFLKELWPRGRKH